MHGSEEGWSPEFLSLEYDVEKAIEDMDREKLYLKAPCWYKITKHIIKEGGDDSFVAVLTRANKIYFEETGISIWQDIPERCWEKALWEILRI